jgi:hypothetical protein
VACKGLHTSTARSPLVAPGDYWELALPHRLLVHGPLSDIADSALEEEERGAVERRLLGVYYQRWTSPVLTDTGFRLPSG